MRKEKVFIKRKSERDCKWYVKKIETIVIKEKYGE